MCIEQFSNMMASLLTVYIAVDIVCVLFVHHGIVPFYLCFYLKLDQHVLYTKQNLSHFLLCSKTLNNLIISFTFLYSFIVCIAFSVVIMFIKASFFSDTCQFWFGIITLYYNSFNHNFCCLLFKKNVWYVLFAFLGFYS